MHRFWQVDPTAALRTLDMGPPADKAEPARAFRAFWGEKAELRRFQDGSITEAVVWEEGGPAERHLIIDRCVVRGPAGGWTYSQQGMCAWDVLWGQRTQCCRKMRAARACRLGVHACLFEAGDRRQEAGGRRVAVRGSVGTIGGGRP